MSESGLPPNWEIGVSRRKDVPYYYNAETGESSWVPPPDSNVSLLRTYLSTHFSKHQGGDRIRASHLLVKHRESRRPASWRSATITLSKEDAHARIAEFETEIKEGKISLGELASKESDCSSYRRKGDLGYFNRGDMQKEFEDAAYALKVGEISPIVESSSGFHLIQRTA